MTREDIKAKSKLTVEEFDRFRQRAFALVASDGVRRALDIRREPGRVRDRYGRHLFGQAALMLRPTFKFAPLQGPDGRPVESLMKVAVEFRPPDPRFDFYGVPPQGEAVADCGGVGAPCPEWRTP